MSETTELVKLCQSFDQLAMADRKDYSKLNKKVESIRSYMKDMMNHHMVLIGKNEYESAINSKEKLTDENKKLTNEMNKLTNEVEHLKNELKEKNDILIKLDKITTKIQKIGNMFIKKIELIVHMRKTLVELIPNCECVFNGSYVRQLFELPRAMSELFSSPGYGNSIGRDLDMYLFSTRPCDLDIERIKHSIERMDSFIKLQKMIPNTISVPKFGDYKLIDITNSTLEKISNLDGPGKKKLLNIPHYLFIFADSNNVNLTVDVLGWKPESDDLWPQYDFNINSISLTKNGFTVDSINDFDNIIFNIINKEACCEIDLQKLHNVISEVKTRVQKFPNLNQLSFFLINRIKIMSCGYTMKCSNYDIPSLQIITSEPCTITSVEAPYIAIDLECGHTISIMAYVGIISDISEYTEALVCPFCRNNLRIKFLDDPAKQIIHWMPELPKIRADADNEDGTIIEHVDEIPLFSNESMQYISELANRKPLAHIASANGFDDLSEISDDESIENFPLRRTTRRPVNTSASIGTVHTS